MLKVVIADNSHLMRVRLRELASQVPNVEVVGEACDGLEALEIVETLRPDVVILDIRMPRANGIQTLKAIKSGGDVDPVVIMLTAFPTRQHRDRCLRAGAAHFFDKTTEFQRVTEVLAAQGAGGASPSPPTS